MKMRLTCSEESVESASACLRRLTNLIETAIILWNGYLVEVTGMHRIVLEGSGLHERVERKVVTRYSKAVL
jgi:hypothetical protein